MYEVVYSKKHKELLPAHATVLLFAFSLRFQSQR